MALLTEQESCSKQSHYTRSIVFVRMHLTEPITLSHCFCFRACASVQVANEPRKEDSADSFPLAVFRSHCLVVRQADQAASAPEEIPLSGTSFFSILSVDARLYSEYSMYNVFPEFQICMYFVSRQIKRELRLQRVDFIQPALFS